VKRKAGESHTKIVFLDISTIGELDNLSRLKEIGEFVSYESTKPNQCIERISDCQVVITNKVVIDKDVIDACPALKLICVAATGMNNIDVGYAVKRGVEVKNVAGYSTESVAQSTFSMLFYLMHRTSYYDKYVKEGMYAHSSIFTHHGRPFTELKGKQFGIIGLGSIGKRVAAIAGVFGCRVVYYSTSGKNLDTNYTHLPLNDLLSTSDIVSVHCPLNEQTKNLIDTEQLKLMKQTAYLLNMGRGGIINEPALAEALEKNWIAGAALDVLTKEPIGADNPLLKIKQKEKILITPHIAWASKESRTLLVEKIVENIREFLSRQTL
jgi:lactate dehydrogenase-like 2-hydroxyacid dehydrogenase